MNARGLLPLLICLALVAALSTLASDDGYENRYAVREVAVGQTGSLREFDVRVSRVALAGSIDRPSQPVATEHVFVVITLEADVRLRQQGFWNIELHTADGRIYKRRPEWSTPDLKLTQPGFSARGTQVYELPVERVTGAALLVGPTFGEVTHYDGAVRIDLGLSSEAVGTPGTVKLPEATQWVTT